jgi:ATP/ADP translocase
MVLAISTPFVGGLGILYVVLLVVLGITSLRKGHWIMFILGIFVPIFWLIGAVIPPTRS